MITQDKIRLIDLLTFNFLNTKHRIIPYDAFDYVLTQRTMRSIVQKPRAKRVRLGLKYKQHLLEYNSEVQATKILKKGVVYGTKFIT